MRFHFSMRIRKVRFPTAEDDDMARLLTETRFANPDAAYLTLVEARRGLSQDQAAALDTRLVMILANHIGDIDVLREAVALAKQAEARG
jgi:hypothetical protein